MKIALHPKLAEHKAKALLINTRALAVNQYGKLTDFEVDLEKRIVKGYLFMWNSKNQHREIFIKGAFAKSIQERGPGSNSNYKIKFLWQHRQDDALALFNVLKEDETGLYFETEPLDDVPNADRALKQLRSGTLNNFSGGFDYEWDKMEYDEKQDAIIIKGAHLFEGSIVGIPSDMGTFAKRSLEEVEDLYDETESFVNSLPRKFQIEARHLFARHKTLIEPEPPPLSQKALEERDKPLESSVDYDYLLSNLKIFS